LTARHVIGIGVPMHLA